MSRVGSPQVTVQFNRSNSPNPAPALIVLSLSLALKSDGVFAMLLHPESKIAASIQYNRCFISPHPNLIPPVGRCDGGTTGRMGIREPLRVSIIYGKNA